MQIINYISQSVLPAIFLIIILCGYCAGIDIFHAFTEGAASGIKTVFSVLPSLLGLLCAVSIFRASGAMDGLIALLSPICRLSGFPAELMSLGAVKMLSSSAATALLLDIFKVFGPDSLVGTAASIMMCCTETIFYTLSVYSSAAGIKRTGCTVICAVIANISGIIASYAIALYMFQ